MTLEKRVRIICSLIDGELAFFKARISDNPEPDPYYSGLIDAYEYVARKLHEALDAEAG